MCRVLSNRLASQVQCIPTLYQVFQGDTMYPLYPRPKIKKYLTDMPMGHMIRQLHYLLWAMLTYLWTFQHLYLLKSNWSIMKKQSEVKEWLRLRIKVACVLLFYLYIWRDFDHVEDPRTCWDIQIILQWTL